MDWRYIHNVQFPTLKEPKPLGMLFTDQIEHFVESLDEHRDLLQKSWAIDGRGLSLLPVNIDPHVHFRNPGDPQKEDWHSGSLVAITGGVGAVFDMPNTHPPTTDWDRYLEKRAIVSASSHIDYGLIFGLSHWFLAHWEAYRDRILALKIYLGPTTGNLIDAGLLDTDLLPKELVRLFAHAPFPIVFHAEDPNRFQKYSDPSPSRQDWSLHSKIRGEESAFWATKKIVALSRQFPQTRFHIAHVSTPQEIEHIADYGRDLDYLTFEVCSHHVLFSTKDYAAQKALVQVNPPVRDPKTVQSLCQTLVEVIDSAGLSKRVVIASDHAPHRLEDKQKPYPHSPSGIPGVDITFSAFHTIFGDRIPLPLLSSLSSANPASIFRLRDYGELSPRRPASFFLFDSSIDWRYSSEDLLHKCGYSPYLGRRFRGRVVMVFLDGKEAYRYDKKGVFYPFAKRRKGREVVLLRD